MARKSNGREGTLDQAIALLVQSQASLVQNHASFLAQLTDTHQRLAKMEGDLGRIERDLDQIKAILLRHEQMLSDLPEAVRQRIGYAPGASAPRSSKS
ncbi:MAG: hypothetical protein HY657_20315 [Acidobacteria bacterium]|nr:hypothetical protein [Acidobacteriota bacterium]